MGQKQNTKTPTQPTLRFKGHTEDWEEKKLGEVAELSDGDWIESNHIFSQGDYRIIQTGNIGIGEFINKNAKYFYQKDFEELKANEVYVGDLLISRLAEPAGRCILAPDLSCKMVTAVDVAIIRKSKDYNSYYLMSYLNTDYNFYNVSNLATGSTRKRISRKNLETIFIPIPSLPEQEKIGSFLSKIDERIELEEKKLELFKERKRGWMQKLFNQEIRFKDENGNDYPDWEEKKLGEIAEIKGGYAFKSKDFTVEGIPVITISNIQKNIQRNQEFNYSNLLKDNILQGKEGDILIALSGATTGKSGQIKNGNYYINQRIARVRHYQDINNFIFNWLNSQYFQQQLLKLLAAGAQPNLSIIDLNNMKIPFPSLPEQQKIADFLSKQDELISAQEEKVSLLKEQKKGLLQQMFV